MKNNIQTGIAVLLFLITLFFLHPSPVKAGEKFPEQKFLGIAYHEVLYDVGEDRFATSEARFIEQMEYIKQNRYHPVSIDDILNAKAGLKPLPDNAILLTVDDGLISFYETTFPILKIYNFPVVLSIVTSWTENGYPIKAVNGQPHDAGHRSKEPVAMNWQQVKEIAASGLVEIASHSHNLHKGVIYNSFGNDAAAASNFMYSSKKGSYEDEESFRKRVRNDLTISSRLIEKHTGKKPRVMTWPYGEFNQIGIEEAAALGMTVNLTVQDGFTATSETGMVKRGLMLDDPGITDFVSALKKGFIPQPLMRAVQVDLDLVYDEDENQQERNLGQLIDRLAQIGANTVFLQAFADPDGDGNASEVYFVNQIMPVKSALFNRAAHQIKTRTKVDHVYAWMPLLSFDIPEGYLLNQNELYVMEFKNGKKQVAENDYKRLSPFNLQSRRMIIQIFEDLAKYSNINGILFQDDAYLAENEDLNTHAIAAYQRQFKNSFSIAKVNSDDNFKLLWTDFKKDTLDKLTDEVVEAVKKFRPQAMFARNIYANILMRPEEKLHFAQDYDDFLSRYDQVVVMAYPEMEQVNKPIDWLTEMTGIAKNHKDGLEKTVFKLQSYDWRTNEWLSQEKLNRRFYQLVTTGAQNIAYYPDDYTINQPDAGKITKRFSLDINPYR